MNVAKRKNIIKEEAEMPKEYEQRILDFLTRIGKGNFIHMESHSHWLVTIYYWEYEENNEKQN